VELLKRRYAEAGAAGRRLQAVPWEAAVNASPCKPPGGKSYKRLADNRKKKA